MSLGMTACDPQAPAARSSPSLACFPWVALVSNYPVRPQTRGARLIRETHREHDRASDKTPLSLTDFPLHGKTFGILLFWLGLA